MRATRTTRRGLFLAEIIVTLPLAAVLLLILGKLTVDAIYLQRVAAQHTNLMLTADALTQQLRTDLWAAVAYERSTDTLTLRTRGPQGPGVVTYTFDADTVRRTTPGGEDRAWRCWRLRFAWHVEPGPRNDLLWLELNEAPPPRAATVPPRRFANSFCLPPGHAAREARP